MIGFKDKSWCYWGVNGICANTKCDRILTPELYKEAVAWWGILIFHYKQQTYKLKIVELN